MHITIPGPARANFAKLQDHMIRVRTTFSGQSCPDDMLHASLRDLMAAEKLCRQIRRDIRKKPWKGQVAA